MVSAIIGEQRRLQEYLLDMEGMVESESCRAAAYIQRMNGHRHGHRGAPGVIQPPGDVKSRAPAIWPVAATTRRCHIPAMQCCSGELAHG